MTVAQAIALAAEQFTDVSTSPRLDAEVLLAALLDVEASWILGHSTDELPSDVLRDYREWSQRRVDGMPVAYITGRKEFFGRQFAVSPQVLVPRAETELLVEEALRIVAERGWKTPNILDVGTGSGCIAITLSKELAGATVTATDVSAEALTMVERNALTHDAALTLLLGDLFDALDSHNAGQYDLIAINPPYVDMDSLDLSAPLHSSLLHEPRNALTPPGGLPASLVVRVIEEAPLWLAPHGSLLVEIGHDQGAIAQNTASRAFPQANVKIVADLNGFDRLLVVEQ